MHKPTIHIVVPSFVVAVVLFGLLAGSNTRAREEKPVVARTHDYAIPAYYHPFAKICDTVFITGDRYLEVSLRQQTVTLHYRDGRTISYPISSGNKFVRDGMDTPPGIFSVQNKSALALSRQFENAKLHSWIGFNGNIGFHGLDGNGYYRNLGVRPSSHGCIRMGREDIKKLYREVRTGTPVLVYNAPAARVFAFADTNTIDRERGIRLTSRNKRQISLLKQRMNLLYAGKLLATEPPPVYMDDTTRLRPGGYDIGDFDKVALHHDPPVLHLQPHPRTLRDALQRGRPLFSIVPPADTTQSAPNKTANN